MPDPLEITTNRGHVMRLSYLSGEAQFDRYEIRFRNERTGEEWAEEIRPEEAQDIVRWIGYPRETSERADRAEELLKRSEENYRRAEMEISRLQNVIAILRRDVTTLVDDLAGAWWLRAAEAYQNLKRYLETS